MDSMWCVGSVCGAMDTHTLVKLASLAPRDEALAIWIPGNAGQAVLVRLAHLGPQLPCLHGEHQRQRWWNMSGAIGFLMLKVILGNGIPAWKCAVGET